MSVIVQTARLIIREFLPEEKQVYLDHFKDERVLQYLPKRSTEERIGIFENAIKLYNDTKTTGIWGIYHKSNNQFAGSCLLRPFENEPGILELGYSLEHKYWQQGLATEMATAIIAHGLANKTIHEIVAVTVPENTASQRVLEKAGLTRVANITRGDEVLAFFRMKD